MSYELLLAEKARDDLDNIWSYRARLSVSDADRLIDKLFWECKLLLEQPFIGRPRPEFGRDLRPWLVENHLIFYRVEPKTVYVVRILHGRMDLEAEFSKE